MLSKMALKTEILRWWTAHQEKSDHSSQWKCPSRALWYFLEGPGLRHASSSCLFETCGAKVQSERIQFRYIPLIYPVQVYTTSRYKQCNSAAVYMQSHRSPFKVYRSTDLAGVPFEARIHFFEEIEGIRTPKALRACDSRAKSEKLPLNPLFWKISLCWLYLKTEQSQLLPDDRVQVYHDWAAEGSKWEGHAEILCVNSGKTYSVLSSFRVSEYRPHSAKRWSWILARLGAVSLCGSFVILLPYPLPKVLVVVRIQLAWEVRIWDYFNDRPFALLESHLDHALGLVLRSWTIFFVCEMQSFAKDGLVLNYVEPWWC